MSRVVVIGSINQDIVAGATRLPRPGETVVGHDLTYSPGGKGANQAVASARAGAPTIMMGALGQDTAATLLEEFLQSEHVATHLIKHVSGPSGTALITVDDTGENTITVVPGANNAVDAALIDRFDFASSDIIVLQNEIPSRTVHHVINRAHATHSPIIYNAAPFRPVPANIMSKIDCLIVNETELSQLLNVPPTSTPTEIQHHLEKSHINAQSIIVTLGRAGLCAQLGAEFITIPGHHVVTIDSTGAGDCFCGAFAAALAEGQTPLEALHFANAAAALAVQSPGAGPSIPTRNQINKFLRLP